MHLAGLSEGSDLVSDLHLGLFSGLGYRLSEQDLSWSHSQ